MPGSPAYPSSRAANMPGQAAHKARRFQRVSSTAVVGVAIDNWVTSSLIASPKDQVVSSGSHPSPAAPVSDPVRVCCVRAKPCPRRLNDQGLLDSYGVYRSPWTSCSFARHLRKHRNQWLFSPPLLHQFRSVSSVRSCDRFYHGKKFFNHANRHTHGVKSLGIMRHCLLIGHKNLGPPLWKLSYSGSHPRRP
jgi:hypothetical protein